LSIEPLANGDTATYPPITGAPVDEATEDHYLGTAYTAANIDDDNNPLVTMRKDLEHHFGGGTTGGANVICFCNDAQTEQLGALTDFREVPDNFLVVGDNVDVPNRLPMAPGITLGRSNGVWVQQWDFVPANYLLMIHLEEAAPLMMRHDPMSMELGTGDFMLVNTNELFPFTESIWRARYGLGAGNRLNGVVAYVAGTSSYTVPSVYT